jgi:hypothetical protein
MKKLALAAATAVFFAIPAAAQQPADSRTEIGMLECMIGGSVGFVVGSSKDLNCAFRPADGRPVETYHGRINRYGLDVGVTGPAVMQWAVLAPTSDPYGPGALAGNYVGASAEATAAIGGGANLMMGGSDQTFMLQPLSVHAQTGLNIALGVSDFRLRAAVD